MRSSIIGFILILQGNLLMAQNDPERKLGSWTGFSSDQKITNKFKTFLQGEIRTWRLYHDLNETLFRVAVKYDLTKKYMLAVGYVRADAWPFDEENYDKFFENRFYQEFQISCTWGKGKAKHRFRIEQRWITSTPYGTEFSNRIRYKLGYNYPLNSDVIEKGSTYLALLNEVFLDLSPKDYYYDYEARRVGLNQNRLIGSIGRQLTSSSNLQLGLLWQLRPNASFFRLVLSFSQNLDFRKS